MTKLRNRLLVTITLAILAAAVAAFGQGSTDEPGGTTEPELEASWHGNPERRFHRFSPSAHLAGVELSWNQPSRDKVRDMGFGDERVPAILGLPSRSLCLPLPETSRGR